MAKIRTRAAAAAAADPNRLLVERAAPRDGEERAGLGAGLAPIDPMLLKGRGCLARTGPTPTPPLKGRGFASATATATATTSASASATPATPRASPRARSVTVNLAESPLGWLKARGHLTQRQFDAGERLRGDWTLAGLAPSVTMRWDAAPPSRTARGPAAPLEPTLARIAAKRRTEAALAAAGPGLSDVLWRVACAGEGMETAERALGWPARAGRVVLTLALDRLADFYRIA